MKNNVTIKDKISGTRIEIAKKFRDAKNEKKY